MSDSSLVYFVCGVIYWPQQLCTLRRAHPHTKTKQKNGHSCGNIINAGKHAGILGVHRYTKKLRDVEIMDAYFANGRYLHFQNILLQLVGIYSWKVWRKTLSTQHIASLPRNPSVRCVTCTSYSLLRKTVSRYLKPFPCHQLLLVYSIWHNKCNYTGLSKPYLWNPRPLS